MNKNIVFIIVSCLILKNAAFAIGIEGGIDTFCPVIQSAVFQVVSVLSMPSVMVAKVMKEMPLISGSGQPLKGPAEKKSNHPRDTKSLFTMGPKEGEKQKLKAVNTGHGIAALSKCADGYLEAANKVFSPWETLICLLVSVFLILLPRRGPPWESFIKSLSTLPSCSLMRIIGFFYFKTFKMVPTTLASLRGAMSRSNLHYSCDGHEIASSFPALGRAGYSSQRPKSFIFENDPSNLIYNPCNRISWGKNEL